MNPTHLEVVTNSENIARGIGTSAVNKRKVACKYGHPFDDTNTLHRRDGRGRACRRCARIYYETHVQKAHLLPEETP